MTDKAVILAIDGRIATVTLNRPEAANGMSLQLTQELEQAANNIAENPSIKAVILTANGKFFSAGGDINAMLAGEGTPGENVRQIADHLHKAISCFSRMDAVVICAINGTAAGAGFSLSVSADIAIAVDSAKFTMAYTKIGLSPDGSSSYFLPRLIGIRKSQELMLTNRVLSAQEAMEWGLVNEIHSSDHLMVRAQELAEIFVNGSKSSNSTVKKLLMATFSNDLEAQMAMEKERIAANADGKDGAEGIASFVEKRAPKFD